MLQCSVTAALCGSVVVLCRFTALLCCAAVVLCRSSVVSCRVVLLLCCVVAFIMFNRLFFAFMISLFFRAKLGRVVSFLRRGSLEWAGSALGGSTSQRLALYTLLRAGD